MGKTEEFNEVNILSELIDAKGKYRKVIQAAVAKWVKRFQDGEIRVDTVEDLRTLMQIDLELQRNIANDQHRLDRIKR
jgi:hypothetical protein